MNKKIKFLKPNMTTGLQRIKLSNKNGYMVIPQGRVNLGYNTCVNCSTTEKYGCAPLINHKTGNSIQIMSQSDAIHIAKLTRRKGYGTMLG